MATPTPAKVSRPKRWDQPFGEQPLTDDEVISVQSNPIFAGIDPTGFKPSTPFRGILKNDTRVVRCQPGQIVFRQGDYGTSAFVVLSGNVRFVGVHDQEDIDEDVVGTLSIKRRSFMQALGQLWNNSKIVEARDYTADAADFGVNTEGLFVQDVSRVLDEHHTTTLGVGELFGELSALGRTPRSMTAFTEEEAELLEIRWQGLRDIMRSAPALQQRLDEQYRTNALGDQLRHTAILSHLSDAQREVVVRETIFANHGDREWTSTYKRAAEKGAVDILRNEPIIAEEEHYPNGLVLIRSGFGRVSQKLGHGHRTLSYLGKGATFGFKEIVEGWRTGNAFPYRFTLRAVGYVDMLLIPTRVMEEIVLPTLPENLLPQSLAPEGGRGGRSKATLPTDFLEEIVETRFINGTATMMIDLERCTHCDDCVRACAASHDGNPRFIRHGPQIGRFMIANACMHCQDPVCMIGCPTGAIQRSAFGGQVTINDPTCIGCGTCANNCPYSNIRMVDVRDRDGAVMLDRETKTPIVKATKCDLCVDQRGGPACQNACPHDALKRVDMLDTAYLVELTNR